MVKRKLLTNFPFLFFRMSDDLSSSSSKICGFEASETYTCDSRPVLSEHSISDSPPGSEPMSGEDMSDVSLSSE